MKDSLNNKKPGSRQFRKLTKHMYKVGPDVTEVGIEFTCVVCGTVLARARMRTDEGSTRAVAVLTRDDGSAPFVGGWSTLLAECDRCGRETRISEEKVTAGLNAIWEQDSRRVVTYRV